ncbi:hypothetical protein ES703_38056 [subsurface metagenome]
MIEKNRIFLFIIVFGLIIYELFQYLSPRSTGDWKDIIATLIAGLIYLGIYKFIFKKHKNRLLLKRTN